jgi:large subunit ribosomal protein L6e
MAKTPKLKNEPLFPGRKTIPKYSRHQMFTRSKKNIIMKKVKEGTLKPKNIAKPTKTVAALKKKPYGKTKREVTIFPKLSKNVSTVPARRRVKNTRNTTAPARVRSSITPGTVLIVLAGKYAGKRVVALKALTSGLILVTGPFKLNGVPITRVNQRYVIATSTKVDISKVSVPEKLDDTYFAAKKVKKAKKTEVQTESLLVKKEAEPKKTVTDEFKQFQQTVDEPILATVKKVEHLEGYLSTLFSLKKGQMPHDMKF